MKHTFASLDVKKPQYIYFTIKHQQQKKNFLLINHYFIHSLFSSFQGSLYKKKNIKCVEFDSFSVSGSVARFSSFCSQRRRVYLPLQPSNPTFIHPFPPICYRYIIHTRCRRTTSLNFSRKKSSKKDPKREHKQEQEKKVAPSSRALPSEFKAVHFISYI